MKSAAQPTWIDAGEEADFEPGAGRKVDACGRAVAVFRGPDGAYFGLADQCPHAGAPLSSGVLRDGRVVCCWHGWTFDPASGRCDSVPSTPPVRTHAVRVEDGRVLVECLPGEAAASDAATA